MYSVTICYYVYSKLDFCVVEVFPRRTGNCGLVIKFKVSGWCIRGAREWAPSCSKL